MSEARYYRQSGHIGTKGPIWMALAALAAAIVLGAVYGYWMWYIYYLLMLPAPPLYGAAVGLAVGGAAHVGKVRNGWFVGLAGAAAGVLAIYTGWVFWLLAWSGHDYFSTFSSYSMNSALVEAAREGIWYDDEEFEIQGGWLKFWWTLEALLIVLGAWAGAWFSVQQSNNTFCEACEEWAEDVYTSPDLAAIRGETDFQARLEADTGATLAALDPVERQIPGVTSRIKIQACTKCWNFLVLDVEKLEHSRNNKGEYKRSDTILVDNLLVDKALYDALKARLGAGGG